MNNQQVSKISNFLRLNYDFHSPYTYLLDGNFIKILVEKESNLEHKLSVVIPGKHHLKVTSCILSELEMLGTDFKLIYQRAKQFRLIKCTHTFQSVDKCILENAPLLQSLVVCSQDRMLRRQLRHKNIGLMYFGPDQRITMEDIQRKKLDETQREQKSKFKPASFQQKQIQQYKQEEEVKEKLKKKKEEFRLASERGIQLKYIKKKVAKGPNPLSIKRKKNPQDQEHNQNKGGEQIPKTKRIRKRNKKQKESNEGN